ncbi:unnamed protein product [Mytilus coruscus]|uniref:B box-type domain-containing protein n=1 Tax=Mytilus coruscus TaxID=42192 RepID=A0A6J8C352_MYTCO|nr:unnamed protein product [Mytilus coruscus]
MSVNRCYECSNVLCEDCYLKHDKLTNTEYHTFQATSDQMLLNNKFFVGSLDIIYIKSFPDGLLVFAMFRSDKLFTSSVSDHKKNKEIKVSGRPCSIAILDRYTVAVLLSDDTYCNFDSIEIVDIRQRQIIQQVGVNCLQRRFDCLDTSLFCSMFYIDEQLYTRCVSQITVIDMSGELDRKIDLEFTPTDMCYDTKAARIYCIDQSEERLICFGRDGNIMFTFTGPGLTHFKRLTIDSEGYVLILCHENSDYKNFKVHRISPDGKSDEVIVTGIHNYTYKYKHSSICFQEESDSMVIGFGARVYIYQKKSVNWT